MSKESSKGELIYINDHIKENSPRVGNPTIKQWDLEYTTLGNLFVFDNLGVRNGVPWYDCLCNRCGLRVKASFIDLVTANVNGCKKCCPNPGDSDRLRFKLNVAGYVEIYNPEHIYAHKDGFISYARYLLEQELHEIIDPSKYDAHHKDGKIRNNVVSNLEKRSKSAHMSLHRAQEKIRDEEIKSRFNMSSHELLNLLYDQRDSELVGTLAKAVNEEVATIH